MKHLSNDEMGMMNMLQKKKKQLLPCLGKNWDESEFLIRGDKEMQMSEQEV